MAMIGRYGTVMVTRDELRRLDCARAIIKSAWDSVPKDVTDIRKQRFADLTNCLRMLDRVTVNCALVSVEEERK